MARKRILITGCSSGIGRALALSCHEYGFSVIATARQVNAIDALRETGMTVLALDVNDREQIRSVVGQAGQVDVLVNNAGYALIGPAIELDGAAVEAQFRTNVFSTLALVRAFAPGMKEKGGGLIVNMGSISGIAATPFAGAYCATKAALHALSDSLRMELAPFGIRVVTVQPGKIESGFGKAAEATISAEGVANSWYKGLSGAILKRAGESQVNATPGDRFAAALVKRVILNPEPPPVVRLGKMSTVFPMLKRILPTPLMDWMLKRKFGLSSLPG